METKEATQTQFSNLLMRWFAYCERFTPRTQRQYKMILRAFALYAPDNVRDLKLEHVEKYMVHLHATDCCNRTINGRLKVIKSFCHWLRDYMDIDIPISKVKMLCEDPPNRRLIDDDQYRRLLAAATPKQADVITFLAHTGLREAEWCSLSWANFSPDFRMFSLVGKGRKRRVVPLSQTAEKILRKYLPAGPIALSRNFFYLKTRGNLRRMLCDIARRADVAPLGSHALRHFFATKLYLKGVPLHMISKILGHADTQTTERIYCHIWPERDLLGLTDCLDDNAQRAGVILPGQSMP